MRKISLNQTIDRSYSVADSNLVELKSAMIGLCADIERYFKVAFDISINEEIDEEAYRRILYVFPRFQCLTIEQFNRFVILFVNIRSVNAHLYLSKPIYLDADLKKFLTSCMDSTYILEDEGRLTIYGAVVILSMLAQKYMIWPFVTSFFRTEFFIEIGKSDEMSKFQVEQQKKLNLICGSGKPLTQNAEPLSGIEPSYLNDVLKKCLTLVFFDLEKILVNYKGCSAKTMSLSGMLERNPLFNEDIISKIVMLRNCWFHGSFIGDIVEYNDTKFEFTLGFAIETLKELAALVKDDLTQFGLIINDISYFGQSLFNYYALRMIEVSYKIFDNRLLTEDKLDSRLDNAELAFNRFSKIDPNVYEMFADLVYHKELRWSVGASKFLDRFPRKFDSGELKIAKVHCDKGFAIGGFRTNKTDIVLALVPVKEDCKNSVNGVDLQYEKFEFDAKYSKFIKVGTIRLTD